MMRRTIHHLSRHNRIRREEERIRMEAEHRKLYDTRGNLQIGAFILKLWEEFGLGVKVFAGFCVGMYAYQKVLIWVLQKENDGAKNLSEEIEKEIRDTTKNFKGDRYIARPARQIDDPDFFNVPAYSITNDQEAARKYRPKLFDDDSLSSGNLQDDRRRSS
eukprot:Tbor_TRINITY_DN5534_c1_g1::TRINITY_DN5534_c1_g1_i1::g.12595::m.12595